MKNTISKIVSLICVICMIFAVNTAVFAAESKPEISIKLDSSKRSANISIKDAGTMIYSAQIVLKADSSANYTLTCEKKTMYGTTKAEDGNLTLYIDSTELLNGNQEIKLAKLASNKEMRISNTAELILVDYSMRPQSYSDVRVSVSADTEKDSDSDNSDSSSSGSGSSANRGSGEIAGGVYNPNTGNNNAAGKRVFNDVAADHWAKEAIDYVVERGLFDGTSDYTFEPSQNMTRAMYVVVLNRFGSKIGPQWQIHCDTPAYFDDIPSGDWYSDAVAWAGGIGLVTGVGDNCFAPNQPVTREQMAVMTVNFAKLCRVELPSNVQAVNFADEGNIHDWASSAVHTAQQAGIIQGRDNNVFAPQDTATRAEVAAIMNRLVKILN